MNTHDTAHLKVRRRKKSEITLTCRLPKCSEQINCSQKSQVKRSAKELRAHRVHTGEGMLVLWYHRDCHWQTRVAGARQGGSKTKHE